MPPAYKFGVELEMFLALKEPPQELDATYQSNQAKLIKVADHLASLYNASITNNASSDQHEAKYPVMARTDWECAISESNAGRWEINHRWEVHDDSSLHIWGIDECEGWPLEFASPIFEYAKGPNVYPWKGPISAVFDVLQDAATIIVDEECSMQISISCNDQYGWDSIEQLKSLCKAVIYFEGAIKKIVPEIRRESIYAKWNASPTQTTSTTTRRNLNFPPQMTLENRLKQVDYCSCVEDIVELMNPNNKRWSWNFIYLDRNPDAEMPIHGRVEFRSPPGVCNSEDCFAWVHFAMEFVHASTSMKTTLSRLGWFEASPKGLFEFLDSVDPIVSAEERLKYREILENAAA